MNYGGIFKCVGNLSFRTNIMYCIRRWFRILFYACFLPVSYVYRWLVHRYRSDLTTSYSNFVTIKKYCKTASLSSSPYRYFSFHTRLFPPFQFFRFILLIVCKNLICWSFKPPSMRNFFSAALEKNKRGVA